MDKIAKKTQSKIKSGMLSKAKKTPQKNQSRGGLFKLGIFSTFLIITGVISLGTWVGLSLILDPNGVLWINRFLPKMLQIPRAFSNPPQTLTAIQEQAKKDNLTAGEPISVGSEVIIPFSRFVPSCNCQSMVELRVYNLIASENNTKTYYRLISQLSIPDLTESFIFGDENKDNTVSLNEFKLNSGAPNLGYWLDLSGKITANQTQITYGQLLHYNPINKQLNILLPWKSLAGKNPEWQKITNNKFSEFVIDQTTDLIPRFQVYQIVSNQDNLSENLTIKLQEISLDKPALPYQNYGQALQIAEKGLWFPALNQLEQIRKDLDLQWTNNAQLQMDVIAYHARISANQCQQDYPDLTEKILTCLYAGKATEAFQEFQAPLLGSRKEIVSKITDLLTADQVGFWIWIDNQLKITPDDDNLKLWGTFLLATQKGRQTAIQWLEKLPETSQDLIIKIEQFLDQVDNVLTDQTNHSLHISKISGIGKPLQKVDLTDWLKPPGVEKLDPIQNPQVWYQIDLLTFNNGKTLQKLPLENFNLSKLAPAQQLWRLLGLDFDPRIQIITKKLDGSQEITLGMIKAVKFKDGYIQLLATGIPLENSQKDSDLAISLVNSEGAVEWLNPEKISLAEFDQSKPEILNRIFPALKDSLIAQGYFAADEIAELSQFVEIMEKLTIQEIDLTGNNQPEIILTLYQNEQGKLTDDPTQKPLMIIFEDQTGAIIYSELGDLNQGSLKAIADLKNGENPVLIIKQGEHYRLETLLKTKAVF